LIALAGCQSDDFNRYTSPEVTGRVLAADTHQPIADARIQRAGPDNNFERFGPLKGGQLLMQPAPVLTGTDGRFVLASRSVFVLFWSPGWWSEPVIFQHSGYETFQTNYTASNIVSNASTKVPVVDAGDVLLRPVAR
jgi:hypothetical protein